MKRHFLTASLIALLSACSPNSENTASDEPVQTSEATSQKAELLLPLPESTSADITEDDLRARISTLADDVFEGRGPGSPAGENSADWIAQEMERIGLKPANNGSYFQTVEMVNQTVDETLSDLTISSAEDAEPLVKLDEAVFWTKRQNELDLSFADSEVLFVGYGTVAPEYGWNDYAGLDATGKTVIMLVNDPGYATQDPDLFRGIAMTYYGRWTYKFEEAARQNATAAIVIHETAPASYGWEVVRNSWTGAQADLVRKDGGAERALLEGWITDTTAKRLFEEAGLDFDAMKEAAKTPGFTPVSMSDLKASGRIVQTVETATSRNVVGMVEGREAPDEYVLYTAHWDHIGKAETPADEKNFTFQADKIYNGAVDNATGIAGILDIAEAMAKNAPRRSVLFSAVTLEESGLLGSAYQAENPIVPHTSVVAGLNMDGMLPTGRTRDMVVVGYGASELEDILTEVLVDQDRVIVPDPNPQAGFFYRSDHISYAKVGIPMLYADGGNDIIEGGKAAGEAMAMEYTQLRYHKPQDEFSDSWNLTGMVEDVQALHDVGRRVADSTEWPTWYEGNEFKAIRESSLAEARRE